jgi:cytochrome P450
MVIKEEHRERQKRIAHIFGPVSVAQIEPIISDHVAKLLHAIRKMASEPIDVMLWFRMLALDVTSI